MSRSDVLVDADWVEAHLDDPKVVIVEVDEDTSAYDKNHIRNAIRIDWKSELQDPVRRDFIDKAGFAKGYALSGSPETAPASLSTKHTLAVTNRGTASASDVVELARHVRDGVERTFGVRLVNEPVLVGLEL